MVIAEMTGLLGEIITALEKPSAYPHPTKNIQRIITGASVVFLTGSVAYKFNKPVNLGFLDFSLLEKRKLQCEKEVRYNSLISPELYLGLVTINKDSNGDVAVNGPGEIIEYAIKMKQLDQVLVMGNLLRENKVTAKDCRDIAAEIFNFHQQAFTNAEIAFFGSLKSIQFNWDENFEQTEKYKPAIISEPDFKFMRQKINDFIHQNKKLLASRVKQGKIKHCHGDFHSGNVFITPEGICIFDGIVFNQRFPCSDVIAEIAFMAMDLEFHGRKDLAEAFIEEYQRLSRDEGLKKLLPFYECYRAYIRAKINCFTSEDNNLTNEEKEGAVSSAKQYFSLAKGYADKL